MILPNTLSACLRLLAALPLCAQAMEVDFSKGDQRLLPEDAVVLTSEPSPSLLLNAERRQVETESIPVSPGEKLCLQIRASVADDFVVERNDRAHSLTLTTPRQEFASTYEVLFYNQEGKLIPPPRQWEKQPGGFFLTSEPYLYTSVFYAPATAASLKVVFRPNRKNTHLYHFSLLPETSEGTVNPNPDFRYGELNYSGWAPQRAGQLYKRPDGKIVMVPGYGGLSPSFPVKAEQRYIATARGDSGTLALQYFDARGNQILSRFLLRLDPEKEVVGEVIPPAGTARIVMCFHEDAIIHEVRIVEAPAK